ncbi:AcrR family transcriptional regulator [Bifidobacterium dolichotidis]|uniref:AcrR family transcriptional regulator n=1 Tax=Bifidobacterium dolichotidis TaxID=2306976 RepID=A0A430FQK8_9BIFI|nr:TetR/AcrR family transcriptional regulator [Bifidobacterium dolichotidis]RSX55117.1 AcrR family transcriptional regulator [Bifidobacterium dolichotidis]
MSRPRRDSRTLPAKDRMENAFWDLLADHEFSKITVTDVVRVADVNRNSFYYHFSGLPELADASILREVEHMPRPASPQAHMHLRPETEWRFYCTTMLEEPEQRQRLDRLALLTGPNSSNELMDSLRDFLRMTMMSILEIDTDSMDVKTSLLIDFSVGGILAVLQDWPRMRETITVDDLMSDDLALLTMSMYMAMSKESLRSYLGRVISADRAPMPNYMTATLGAPTFA